MRASRLHYPKPKDIALVTRALSAAVPMDKPLNMGWRESDKAVPNLRCATQTGGREWYVDVYAGHFYCVGVSGHLTEIVHSLPEMVRYLCRMLGVRPNTSITQ
jgi:hypothetical protein